MSSNDDMPELIDADEEAQKKAVAAPSQPKPAAGDEEFKLVTGKRKKSKVAEEEDDDKADEDDDMVAAFADADAEEIDELAAPTDKEATGSDSAASQLKIVKFTPVAAEKLQVEMKLFSKVFVYIKEHFHLKNVYVFVLGWKIRNEENPRSAESFQPAQGELDEDLLAGRRLPQASDSLQRQITQR